MKNLGTRCFRRRVLRYGGQVAFTRLDSVETLRIKKSAFAVTDIHPNAWWNE